MTDTEIEAMKNILIKKGIITEKEIQNEQTRIKKEKSDYYKNDTDYHTY